MTLARRAKEAAAGKKTSPTGEFLTQTLGKMQEIFVFREMAGWESGDFQERSGRNHLLDF